MAKVIYSALFVLCFLYAHSQLSGPGELSSTMSNSSFEYFATPPRATQTFHLDLASLRNQLSEAPLQFHFPETENPSTIDLPFPDGKWVEFEVYETQTMAPALAGRYPEIKTYIGIGTSNPAISVRFSITPNGFSALIFNGGEVYFIEKKENQFICSGELVTNMINISGNKDSVLDEIFIRF